VTLAPVARIPLPPHTAEGGFDHAAVHVGLARLFVAHTSNDCVEVVDLRTHTYLGSIPSLPGVAGVWVAEEPAMLFTSNRGEDTASVFEIGTQGERFRFATGRRPNGLGFDPARRRLLVAGVGESGRGEPPSATVFDADVGAVRNRFPLPGRTRWTLYHSATDAFYVNIADPPGVVEIDARDPDGVRRFLDVPAVGPHGLEQDPDGRTLYCACDDGQLATVDLPSGEVRSAGALSGAPDVLWLDPRRRRLYCAIGSPGTVDVFRTDPLGRIETVATSEGAHTLTVDPSSGEVHVFLPDSHEDLVLGER
jgi:DNA-binding beta-propeller fold protein YncE